MASLRLVLFTLVLVAATVAQNLTSYIKPECAQACVEDSISGVCNGPDDSQCLCTSMRTIGPGSLTCAEGACPGNSTEQIQSSLRSSYVQYCSDVGAFPSGGWFGSGWSSMPSASKTSTTESSASASTGMSTMTTSAAASTTAASISEQSSSSPGGGGGSGEDLSKGAVVGIAIGAGIGCILTTGGLLLFAFRLGKGHWNRNQVEASQGPGRQEEGGGDPNELDNKDKPQLEGQPISELQTDYTISGPKESIKELPTQERPAELSAEALSRDSLILPRAPWQ